MEWSDVFKLFEEYYLWFIIIGVGVFLTMILPRILSDFPFSMPMVLIGLGFLVIVLPLGLTVPVPAEFGKWPERITEFGVIISLMGAGLNIDRPPRFSGWGSTWRLLGITMPITIILTFLLGLWALALAPATAMLLAAVIAPTDPVLASEVQVGGPSEGLSENPEVEDSKKHEDELRFALTSEAGLNDGLAFPFTHMAVAMVTYGAAPENWFSTWFTLHVLYELAVGLGAGWILGYVFARLLLYLPAENPLAKAIIGLGALSATMVIYGITESLNGYGFIAVFVGAIMIRNHKRDHEFHRPMHVLVEKTERIFVAGIMVGLGAAIAGGLFNALDYKLIFIGLAIIFLVRPLSGIIGLFGFKSSPWRERLAISFFGIRGIGSLYYLAYATNNASFEDARRIWALAAFVILVSVVVHGITASPITKRLDADRKKKKNP